VNGFVFVYMAILSFLSEVVRDASGVLVHLAFCGEFGSRLARGELRAVHRWTISPVSVGNNTFFCLCVNLFYSLRGNYENHGKSGNYGNRSAPSVFLNAGGPMVLATRVEVYRPVRDGNC
jgi:hypothetical protein